MRKRWMVTLLMVVLAAGMPTLRAQEPEGADEDNPPDGGATVPEWAKVSREQIEAAAKLKIPVAKEVDLGGEVKMKFVLIPAGEFMMGSPAAHKDPRHRVRISKAFYMGIHEVTQEEYEKVMGKNPSGFKGAKNPVEEVSWNDASEFCRKLSTQSGGEVRLPTEAEWEYACRAGTTTVYSFGNDAKDLHRYGNYCDRSYTGQLLWQDKAHDDGHDKTARVGSFLPNAWGLHDMHGNVYEWCQDWYDSDYYGKSPASGPAGPRSGSERVLRGGSWAIDPASCSSADRIRALPTLTGNISGFRVVFAPQVVL